MAYNPPSGSSKVVKYCEWEMALVASGNGVEVNQDRCWSGVRAEKSSAVVLRKGGRSSETSTTLVSYSRSISVFSHARLLETLNVIATSKFSMAHLRSIRNWTVLHGRRSGDHDLWGFSFSWFLVSQVLASHALAWCVLFMPSAEDQRNMIIVENIYALTKRWNVICGCVLILGFLKLWYCCCYSKYSSKTAVMTLGFKLALYLCRWG